MIDEISRLLDEYHSWLRDRTVLREVGDWVEITTPFLDRNNDCLQIYARSENGGIALTDDGYILDELDLSGVRLDTPRRQQLLQMTLAGFGVQQHSGELRTHATRETFPLRKHNLVQAMLAVNDMFFVAAPTVASLFYEDVVTWLDANEIRYTPKVKFSGKSGFDQLFDFVIPKSKASPERILRAINRPTRETAQSLLLAWLDTKEVRRPDSRAYAVLNDSDHEVAGGVLDAFRSYEITPLAWSQRDAFRHELAA